jgi:hypothetical protein
MTVRVVKVTVGAVIVSPTSVASKSTAGKPTNREEVKLPNNTSVCPEIAPLSTCELSIEITR